MTLLGVVPALFVLILSGILQIAVWKGLSKKRPGGNWRFVSAAHNFARRADVALPSGLEARLASYLRQESLLFAVLQPFPMALSYALLGGTLARGAWSAWYPWLMVGCLVPPTAAGLLVATRPRWQGPSELRVARAQAVPLRAAFTSTERAGLVSVMLLTLSAGFVGLWGVSAPLVWFALWPAALFLASALWWQVAMACMAQPSAAGDMLDLAWDDVLRLHRTRTATAIMGAGPLVLVFTLVGRTMAFHCTDFGPWRFSPTVADVGQLVGFVLAVAVCSGLAIAFRRGGDLWRSWWRRPATDVMTWPSAPPTFNGSP
ncbi:MAG TPA: hypothetical protein VME46_18820 [Acidimicrobiales bacterium]|nr:hypothetical protein [Acidimicrobiales bacterium]